MVVTTHLQPVTRAPSLALLGSEPIRAALEYAHWRVRKPAAARSGDGHPVIVFPGLGASPRSVAPLTAFCRALGYDAQDWGRGLNTGPRGRFSDWLDELAEHVRQRAGRRRMSLIGWSLGGIYAREIAKILNGRVRRVITLGTPFAASPRQTHASLAYALLSGQQLRDDPRLARRLRTAPDVPTTCIYSRSDGIVAWQTCVQTHGQAHVENVEVPGSHCGLAWNRHVLAVVADRLRRSQTPAV
jgi:thioesterase domain-containing protein